MPSIPGRLTPALGWLAAFLFVILGGGTYARAGMYTLQETLIRQETRFATKTYYAPPSGDRNLTSDESKLNLPRTVDSVGSDIGPDLIFNFDTLGHAQAFQDYRGISAVEAYYHDPSFATYSSYPSNPNVLADVDPAAAKDANNFYSAMAFFSETITQDGRPINQYGPLSDDAIFRFVVFPSQLKIIDELPYRNDRTPTDENPTASGLLHAEFTMDLWVGKDVKTPGQFGFQQLYLYRAKLDKDASGVTFTETLEDPQGNGVPTRHSSVTTVQHTHADGTRSDDPTVWDEDFDFFMGRVNAGSFAGDKGGLTINYLISAKVYGPGGFTAGDTAFGSAAFARIGDPFELLNNGSAGLSSFLEFEQPLDIPDTSSAVPEPGSFSILLTGLGLLGLPRLVTRRERGRAFQRSPVAGRVD